MNLPVKRRHGYRWRLTSGTLHLGIMFRPTETRIQARMMRRAERHLEDVYGPAFDRLIEWHQR